MWTRNYDKFKEHLCFKNWPISSSLSSMEALVIVEEFKRSEEMYGIRYNTFVADSDSSVFKKLLDI